MFRADHGPEVCTPMSQIFTTTGVLMTDLLDNKRIAFIKAGWHAEIINQGQHSFIKHLAAAGISETQIDVVEVPGSLEIPLLAQKLAQTGNYALIACGGLLVDGGIYRHEFVTRAVIDGIMRVMLDTGTPVLSMVLTPKNPYEHERDQAFFLEHFVIKGEELANAAVTTLTNMQKLKAAATHNT
jgi:6,7-dimethyl-8-ribityllumazine synthase